MIVHEDGSIVFDVGEQLPILKMYQVDPTNDRRFVPKFKFPCKARLFVGKVRPCSRQFAFAWWCTKFDRSTLISDCEKCNVPE